MIRNRFAVAFLLLACCERPLASYAQDAPQVVQINFARLWQRVEFRLLNVPPASNPFEPDSIRVDAAFHLPSGRTLTVPAFWFQDYQRGLSGGSEVLTRLGSPEWRLRFCPPEPGACSVSVTIHTNGQPLGRFAETNFTVESAVPLPGAGYVRIGASRQYFEAGEGQALRLIGENVCWPGSRGTYDYDKWLAAMQGAGENYARLWMCPWAFGIETDANSLTRYRQDRAWQLDYVLQSAEARGIYLLLCLDYHGMFEVTPDYWGGNNNWPLNPYNSTNGGPCLNQNAFFTNTTAKALYQKRLRYLIARYGYSPNLLAWQFFNEIDNVYTYLNPKDVAAWHAEMGGWMHTNDPFGHLVTTSLTGGSDRPELWSVSQLDFAAYHSYGEPNPASRLASVAQSFLVRYGKPVLIDEFGTDWRGWNRTNDLYLRGFRQGLWGGALGGSVGTSMPWYWENIQSENLYPLYSALGKILNRTGWGRGAWTNLDFQTSGTPPTLVGQALPAGQPFSALLALNGAWGVKVSGQLAIPSAAAAGYSTSTLNGFVHGVWHSDLKTPFRLSAWFTNDARLVMHLNSVAQGAILVVRADNTELFRTNLPNLDGGYQLNNEYNLDLPVKVPAGQRLLQITNAGSDWFCLDWVRLEQVLPATYAGDWRPSPEALGLRGPRESLLYVVAPGVSFPASATESNLPVQTGQTIILTNWPTGSVFAEWYDPATGTRVGASQAIATNHNLSLPLPDFRADLAGIVYPPPVLSALGVTQNGGARFRLDSETGGHYLIERSLDLSNWTSFLVLTNAQGTVLWSAPSTSTNPESLYRAKQSQ